jgi:hypothetical protein
MNKIKTMTSHTGLSRWLAETTDANAYLARAQVKDIPSPYRYSPVKEILDWNGRKVVWFETRHKRYEVFEVPADMLRFKTDEEATNYNTDCNAKAGIA